MAKFSVIVPIYNSEEYLKKCLDGLVNQTFKNIEIILVNDGSTDNSENIINDYLNDTRIIYLKKENGGQASARNLGLSKATGEYISFIDSDDYVDLEMFEKLNKCLNNWDIICFDYFLTINSNDTYHKVGSIDEAKEISVKDYFTMDVGPWNKIYKLEFLKKFDFKFPEKIIYEDYAVIPTLAKGNPKVYYLNDAFYHYVHHDGSTVHNFDYQKKYEDIFKATSYLYENLIGNGYDLELEYLICFHFLYLGSLNFYKFKKYDQIDKISIFMKEKFPTWYNNKYVKQMSFKQKVLMRLFYLKKYNFINFVQKIKR